MEIFGENFKDSRSWKELNILFGVLVKNVNQLTVDFELHMVEFDEIKKRLEIIEKKIGRD